MSVSINMKKGRGSVVINGNTFFGNSIILDGDNVTIDGVHQHTDTSKKVSIIISGDVDSISTSSGSVTVKNGGVGKVSTQSGDVECVDVSGSITTMSGDVDCVSVKGSIKTMSGDVSYKARG